MIEKCEHERFDEGGFCVECGLSDHAIIGGLKSQLLSAQRLAAEARAGAIEECVDAIKSAGLSIGAAPGATIRFALFYAIDKIRALASGLGDEPEKKR